MADGTEPTPKLKLTFPPDAAFQRDLRNRVDAFFAAEKLDRGATPAMWWKTAFWIALAYGSLLTAGLAPISAPLAIALYLVAGFGMACVGFNVAHDGTHGGTSSNKRVNTLASWSFDAMGVNSNNWKVAHNLLHHTYTNVPGTDTDLEPGAVLRFQPFAKLYPWHRVQIVYAWFLYCLTALIWVYKKDLLQALRPHPRTGAKTTAKEWAQIAIGKTLHGIVFLAVPLTFGPQSAFVAVGGYIGLMMVGGFTLAMVFQLAHVVEGVRFPRPDENGRLESSFFEHEMLTTANFGKSKLCTFITGGLDHQIEHHLFPTICHVHYPRLSPIVEACARDHGLPYMHSGTFLQALASHARMMNRLGQGREVASLEVPFNRAEAAAASSASSSSSSSKQRVAA
ncbi:MAG: acyl-CoA desaturase [Deltaproteobacteria bacterium]|nr:acyl-CoA desaturase [Deltaproteobacteria bacterium]